MSINYPIIVKDQKIYFSTRLDLRNGTQTSNFTINELMRSYGMVIPDGRTGLNVIDYIEHAVLSGDGKTFLNRALIVNHLGEIRDVTAAKLGDVKTHYEIITPISAVALTILGGEDQQAAQCNVLMKLCDDPWEVLWHVAKMANDMNPCFIVIDIPETAKRLSDNGDTKNFYDYFTVNRKRNELIRNHIEEVASESVNNLVSSILEV